VNWAGASPLAVLIAAAVGFLIGGAWYSPYVFGKLWARLSPLTDEEMRARSRPAFITAFVALLVSAYALALLLKAVGAAAPAQGALIGFLVWFGFVGPVTLSDAMFGAKPVKLWVLDTSYRLVSTVAMGVLLAKLG
jgi:hypothetical protein